ncbi:PAS domain-containing protein [archaeon]|nr:MAG: PAS domain-containing protein [archaeon]
MTADALEHLEILQKQESFKSSRKNYSSVKTSSIHSLPSNRIEKPYVANLDQYPPSALLSQPIWNGQELCQTNDVVRSTFNSYVRSLRWLENLTVDIHEQVVMRRRTTQDTQEISFNEYSVRSRTSSENNSKDMEQVANTMMRCTQLKIRDSMHSSPRRKHAIETCFPSDQIRNLLLTTLWPLFIETEGYKQAVQEHSVHLYDLVDSNESSRYIPQDTSAINQERIKHIKDIYLQTAQRIKEEEVQALLVQGKWASELLDYVDTMPLSVSIHQVTQHPASPDRSPSFPIVFVNRAYEQTTLFSKSDVLGRTDEFLIGPSTEADQLLKLKESLYKGEGAKIAITHTRKNGSDFLDFLALRPVVSRRSEEYKYVIMVQYDISKAEANLKEIRMVADFLTLVGNILKG